MQKQDEELLVAAEAGKLRDLLRLLKAGADVNTRGLAYSCSPKEWQKHQLQKATSPAYKKIKVQRLRFGKSALMLAAAHYW